MNAVNFTSMTALVSQEFDILCAVVVLVLLTASREYGNSGGRSPSRPTLKNHSERHQPANCLRLASSFICNWLRTSSVERDSVVD